ncbi:unnamed protein product [Euphydryas editha]|uniref:Uncharacterized protein n=1 Tax=Euphydryas editha TaxID=104508 RepID=A0AAU9TIK9_EUPED|nr:unnamed protein product [Euphydryas editha]
MSRDQFQKPYKQRFKGVETFLRRVAFNLGNTASQTEVKIISCIPIDVTDLQQKIINLEKQLHEARQQGVAVDEKVTNTAKDKPSAVVNTALYGSTFAKPSSTISYCSNKPIGTIKSGQVATCCGSFSSRAKKSNVSFVFPALSAPDTKNSCDFNPRKGFSYDNAATIERCKNIFRKRKRKNDNRGNNKMKTHLVYYAQTNSPFNMKDVPLKYNEILSSNDKLCMSHLNNVIRRQYDPNEVVEEFSDTSNLSRPICRDVDNKCKHLNHYESDICSCCHGKFQNIDNYMTKTNYDLILTKLHNSLDNTKTYYDSNHYDIIPVKENNNKIMKYNLEHKKDKANFEIKCWPEPLRTKQRYHPFIVNYHSETLAKRHPNKRLQPTIIQEKIKSQKINISRNKIKKPEQTTGSGTSKSCYIDYSDIYPKQDPQQPKSRKSDVVKTILRKNESVETDEPVTKLEVSNQSTQLELIEDCREVTLNQIKTILQSVLEEVKTNAKLNNGDEIVKKDAVVQKGESQNSMPGDSTLLHSYTYNNSYNADPYLPSCSKQIPQYFISNVPCQPFKCLQNFPVFIQPTSGRHLCTCYYRKSSCKPHNKLGTTAATNTDNKIDMSSSKETEKLIKEIYKSMALNMDFPTKDSSTSEYNDLQSDKISTNTMDDKNKETTNKRNDKVEIMVSPIQSIMNHNKLGCTLPNGQSGDTKQAIKPLFVKAESTGNINKDRLELHSIRSSGTIAEDEEVMEELSDESDSDDTVILEEELEQHQKPNKGFFSRMFKSVKLFKKKKQTRDEKDASDSDDYETIYSEKSVKVSPRSYNEAKYYTKSRKYDLNDKNRAIRSPYLEQEYRRHWNERLTFREQESKCTSERPVSRHSSINRAKPVYWNNYEARSAIVNHELPNHLTVMNPPKRVKQNNLQKNESVKKFNHRGLGWLKKHKFGINCGEQWKKFILEN